MADNSSGNSPENLVFRLIAETKAFTANLKKSLDDGLKMIQSYQKKASDTLSKGMEDSGGANKIATQFEKLTAALKQAQTQFVALQKSALGWDAAAKHSGATSAETAGLYDKLSDAAIRQGITMQKAAMDAIASGQAQVRAVQEVLALNKWRVLSEKEVSNAILQLEQNVNKAARAEGVYVQKAKEVVDANKKIEDSNKKTGLSFKEMGKFALTLAGVNGILGVIQNSVEFLQNAAKASIDFAQAQFGLAMAVRAANIESNGQAGTLQEWQERVQKLRKELSIYSETDVTKAVSRVAGLTRAFGLNADQQEKLIKTANVLAASIGVDLSQGLQDVVQYMGGSSVVLDKYNLAIRDTDKAVAAFQLGFTEKLQRGTNGLTSQQLALAGLETLFTESQSLVEAFGDYQETLPGQIKAVDAAIADETKLIGSAFEDTVLLFKNLFLEFLNFLSLVLVGLKDTTAAIENINKLLGFSRTQQNAGGGRTIRPEEAGANLSVLTSRLEQRGVAPSNLDEGTGIRSYTKEQLKGSEEDWKKYEEYVKATNDRIREDLKKGLFPEHRVEFGGVGPDDRGETTEDVAIDENFADAQEKLGKELVDNFNDMTQSMRDALMKRNADIRDANEDFTDAMEDLGIELKRKIADLENDIGHKRGDAIRNYFDDLDDLEREQGEKRQEIIEDTNNKTEEIYEDYYRRLRELDNQYYFDLRDAVAENDAVAIKRLERKYALDKQKINEALQDRLDDEQDSVEDRLDELENETKNRADELKRRFDTEMEMINLEGIRRREEINLQNEREEQDLAMSHQRQLDDLEEAYQEELDLIELHYQDKLTEITRSLAEQYQLEKGSVRKLFTLYDEYYGDGGKLWEMVDEFYEHQNELAGEFNDSIGDLDNTGGADRNVQVTTTNNGTQMNVVISGDGTIPDSTIEKLAEEIAERISDTIETIVVTRGATGGGR